MKKQGSPLCFQGWTATQQLDNEEEESLYDDPAAAEESGWTTYLDDFSKQQQRISHNNNGYCSSSLVSDAASQYYKLSGSQNKKLSLMRTKQNKNKEEEEDTATSPVHSPKVINDFKRNMEMKKELEGHGQKTGGGPFFGIEDGTHYLDEGTRDGSVFNGHEYTSLKKRGLCLVPLSLFSNYNA